jgi:hypothetical protein
MPGNSQNQSKGGGKASPAALGSDDYLKAGIFSSALKKKKKGFSSDGQGIIAVYRKKAGETKK